MNTEIMRVLYGDYESLATARPGPPSLCMKPTLGPIHPIYTTYCGPCGTVYLFRTQICCDKTRVGGGGVCVCVKGLLGSGTKSVKSSLTELNHMGGSTLFGRMPSTIFIKTATGSSLG